MIDPQVPFEDLFYSDYFGVRLTPVGQGRLVTWSVADDVLDVPGTGLVDIAADLGPYLPEIARAFELWDAALDTIDFEQANDGNAADITVGLTDLGGRGGTWGYWNSAWNAEQIVTRSTIQFDVSDIGSISVVTIALHEIGNVLGLGDIAPSRDFRSVQEDPIPETFRADSLWQDDVALIRRYYGEEAAPSPKPPSDPPVGAPVVGGAGDDRLFADAGDNRIDGGAGRDTLVLPDGIGGYALRLASDGTLTLSDNGRGVAGTDTLFSIEALEFAKGDAVFPDARVDLAQLTGIATLGAAQITTFVEMYVAYFNRAPDAVGLNYWGTRLSEGMTLADIAESFFVQDEAAALYPPDLDNAALVRAAYDNFLGRAPDEAGLAYWASELDAGFSRGKFMLALINGARDNDSLQARVDVQTIEAKGAIGLHFAAIHGLTDVEQATEVMQMYDRADVLGYGDALRRTDAYAEAAQSDGALEAFTMALAGVVEDPSIGWV